MTFRLTKRYWEADYCLVSILEIATRHGQTDSSHHKAWVIDQIVRVITGDQYEEFLAAYKAGDDGSETYEWDEGIAP